MPKPLIIVESPAKTRTLRRFLGEGYDLEATMGHVRDLPKKTLGVNVEAGFIPEYEVLPDRRAALTRLRGAAKKADAVYLATDPDREGEAIAWHVAEALELKDPRRIEFNEITRSAVEAALEHPRAIDLNRVNAQQARRLLDRLVGYKLSPLLQKKLRQWPLSAGRVQSVAVKLICDREREIEAFVPEEYWNVAALLSPLAEDSPFEARLVTKEGKKLKVGAESVARDALRELWDAAYRVTDFKRTEQRRRPPPPFTTSTLQQAAFNRLRFSAKQTMRIAQKLYEGLPLGGEGEVGLITYMRTDSTRVAAEAQEAARAHIREHFGPPYLPEKPPVYASAKGAQEAHEAIRPTSVARDPDRVKQYLRADQFRLYQLIWSRFLASQMTPQVLDVNAAAIAAGPYGLEARGVRIKFPGFTTVYPTTEKESFLPALEVGQLLSLLALSAAQKFTEPPPRYTEATLVKTLEANGIGRPSTYAPIISTILDRGYVYLGERKFRPTDLGSVATEQLVQHFPDIINVEFTAAVEDKLDKIEEARADWVEVLSDFYEPFEQSLQTAGEDMKPPEWPVRETDEKCDQCGKPMLQRVNRWGPYLACSGYPACRNTKRLPASAEEAGKAAGPTDITCEKCGKPMVKRMSRRGPFLGCSGYPECDNTKSLSRTGEIVERKPKAPPEPTGLTCEKCGKPMVKRIGKWGPFISCSGFPKCRNLKKLPESDSPPNQETDAGSG